MDNLNIAMKRIAITGANGVIGKVLKRGLSDCKITPLDLPEIDVREYEKLLEVFPGHDAIIHLGWDTETDNYSSGKINPDNALMVNNVYRAGIETKVPRVIMASSVHADKFSKWKGSKLMSPNRSPVPDSPYGANKVFMEALGKHYATKGLEVICIRFGVVRPENRPLLEDYSIWFAWLSYGDCVGLVRKCIEVETIPNKFLTVYGVSDNKNRIHDYCNPLGWVPQDNAEDFYKYGPSQKVL